MLTGADSLCAARLCSYSSQTPSADSCDTSHLVFELRLQLSVTGTPTSINISSHNSRASWPAGSSVLTDIFCLLPEGLQTLLKQRHKHNVLCWSCFYPLCPVETVQQKRRFCVCFCCVVLVYIWIKVIFPQSGHFLLLALCMNNICATFSSLRITTEAIGVCPSALLNSCAALQSCVKSYQHRITDVIQN